MQYEDREDYKEAMARITKRMADQIDRELLERMLQDAHTRAQLRSDRPEMKRLEQQMKRNRC